MIEELKSLGLQHYEVKALEVLLKEKLILRELSRKAEIPFGKVYSVVKNLKERGLVLETNSRPKLIYVENASDVVSKLIKEKQDKDKTMLERLREVITDIDKEKQRETKFFQIGINREERKNIQLRSFQETEDEVLQILNIYHNPNMNRQSKLEYEKEIEKAAKRGVEFRAIYPKKVKLPKILEKLEKTGKFQVKRLDTDFIRCDIIDGKKVLIKLVQKDTVNSGGSIFVENEKLAENLTRIFNELWEQAD